jgi:ornithine cyclodeaminase/alanine dehydrogenase
MLILSQKDLSAALRMADVIGAVEAGFLALARGEARAPDRLHLSIPKNRGVLLEMPARLPGALGTKIVSVFEENIHRGMEIVQAVYLMLDAETGAPLALMDGRLITAMRTAATSAVATKFMAASGDKQLAVFGAGVQARFHIEAMLEVSNIARVMIASRDEGRAAALAAHVSSTTGIACEVVSAVKAASTASLICTCTSAASPLFDGRLLAQGTHINAVGAFTPATRELDTEAVRRARVIIDAESAAGREAGEILIPLAEGAIEPAHIRGTLAEVVSGQVRGRESVEEITLFKSCGLAIEDLVTARLAYERAISSGAGTRVEL